MEIPKLSRANEDAYDVWRMLGSRMDWVSLPIVCELYQYNPTHELVWRVQMWASEVGNGQR